MAQGVDGGCAKKGENKKVVEFRNLRGFLTRSNAYSGQSNVCTQRDAQAHDHDETDNNSHARVGAMTIHHPDWLDRHPGGSRQDTHGTLGPVRGCAVGGSTHLTEHVTKCTCTTW